MLKTTRRNFLKSTSVAGAGVILMHNLASGESPNEKINFAAIGVSGKGASDIVRNNCRKFVRGLYIDDLIAEGVYDDDMDAASTWYNPLTWYWTGDRRGKAWQSHGYGLSILLE